MEKRIIIITGHYGSGKTEFAINLSVKMKAEHSKVALIDFDIANPYFRSRERQEMLENKGVSVFCNTFGTDITVDLPAITAAVRAPFEDDSVLTIVDAGGDASGARVLNQFKKYFLDNTETLLVVNANRPGTSAPEGIEKHMFAIMAETGLEIKGIVNNTHLIKETSVDDVLKGYELCRIISERHNIPIVWNCCKNDLAVELGRAAVAAGQELNIFPLTTFMRTAWMDINMLRRRRS